MAINNRGQVVGDSELPDGRVHGFVFMNGGMTDLGTMGGADSYAYGINDQGHIAGMADLTNGMHHAFFATNENDRFFMMDLGTFGGTNSAAYCINAMDGITGEAQLPSGISHAFMWTNMMTGLADIDGDPASSSAGHWINGSNQIAGSRQFGGRMHAFLAGAGRGGMMDMGTMGGVSIIAHGMNSQGTVVGESLHDDGSQHAFYGMAGMMGNMTLNDLGTLGGTNSRAFCINASGAIVGAADWTNGLSHAFLYAGGMMRDLNDLIPSGSPWQLVEARGINDMNQIIGHGIMGHQTHGFLLTPVAAPLQITSIPTNMTVGPGAAVQMNAIMDSGEPLQYQWMFNGADLAGETNATLVRLPMGPSMVGNYTVVATNAVGMVARLSASLAMLSMMQPSAGSGPNLVFYGPVHGHYRVEHAADVGSVGAWTLMTNIWTGTNAFRMMLQTGRSHHHFFRAIPVP